MPQERQTTRTLVLLGMLGVGMATSGYAAELTGVVRDARGVPQMGVLVEMLGAGEMETALTDLHGRFSIRGIQPGQYDLRTSGAFFSPNVRRGLRVHAGPMPALTVVLSGWFDELGSLAPHTEAVGDAVADWKWTLRSPAARPMLRLAEEDDDAAAHPGPVEAVDDGQRHGKVWTGAGTGAFGQSAAEANLLVGATGGAGHVAETLELSSGSAGYQGGAVPSGVRASYESGIGQGVRRQVTVSARSLPQVVAGSVGGMEAVRIDAVERVEVGSRAAMEVGSRAEGVRAGGTAVDVSPLLRLMVTPAREWTVRYEMRSATGQGMEDGGRADASVPMVVTSARGLAIVRRQQQALRVERRAGRVRVEGAVTRERAGAGVVSGVFSGGAQGGSGFAMVDTATGTFRRLGPDVGGWGGAMALEAPVGDATTVAARVLMGPGLALVGTAAGQMRDVQGRAMLLEVTRSVRRSGTEAAVSYRWQPAGMLTTVGAFEASEVSPYLGVHVRQRLPMCHGEGGGAELTVDASNVLGEGYHTVEGPQMPETLLMSALREVRAGIEVSF